ncbi:MAG TPA: FAD-dependent oxidoreductase [Steroidobacteraceae bacterium]|nr:FAD-dependent oxidoreductase [Steroidobacteraceae bacterium]
MATALPIAPTARSTAERLFPQLSAAQVARVRRHGHCRALHAGEMLYEVGDPQAPFLLVVSGRVEIVRHTPDGGEELVAVHGPGQFTGEVSLLSGRRTLVSARAAESGEAVELDRERLLALVQTDAEIGELLMRAFILRRVELISRGVGDAIVIGSSHCARTLGIKEFLTRNAHPFTYVDLDGEPDVQALLERFQVTTADIPVVVCRCEFVLRHPTDTEIAECLGLNATVDVTNVHDVVVVGGGPAGLAAAVYAASEGLDVLVVEARSPGGQAGASSRIENYLGFPTGISGQALAGRAFVQAQKFGAQVLIARNAVRLDCAQMPYRIEVDATTALRARTVVIATGAEYRKPLLPDLPRFEGIGVYYGATFMEAQLCAGEDVVVIGGGNSAGQAAVYLADSSRHVHLLVRADGLAGTMSRYLVRRIEEHPSITLHAHTEIAALEGIGGHLGRVQWRHRLTGVAEWHAIRHVFVMTGAVPATTWLDGCVALDSKGFVVTGPELDTDTLVEARWPLRRAPYLLETSLPGIFAVGDVRAGNVKRVASAVGEGSIAISFVHRVLAE